MTADLTRSQHKALDLVHRQGITAVSNHTDPDAGVIDARVAHRLIVAGYIEQRGFNRLNQALVRITGTGIEALDGHR